MKIKINCQSYFAYRKVLELLRLQVNTNPTVHFYELPHTDKQADVQNHSEMESYCCVFDINKIPQQGNTNHYHEIYPQSGFEIFCDRCGIDPLTLDKKGLQRIAREFAKYRNQIRQKIGGRKILLSQVYKDVRDYKGGH